MTQKKDLNKIVEIERAIAKKFGEDAVINPKSLWTPEKEEEYLRQSVEFYSRQKEKRETAVKTNEEGFLLSQNLITKKNERKCPVCETFSFELRDDLYMNKFECCFTCYIQWVENREERWLKGWRPSNEKKE